MNLNDSPKDFRNLFLDMNSFFASVEQQVRPELRGKPVGVAPYTGDSGCIIAASREAKSRGVSISRIGDAKKLCPGIKIVEARPALYMCYHKEIKKVIESFTPYYRPMSIDEFDLRLTPREQNEKTATELALNLKKALHERVGDFLTCSVGIGPNTFLAKMAAERKKPDGLTVVKLAELKQFYSGLKSTDITGINHRLDAALAYFGINNAADLFDCSLLRLRQVLKHPGRLWYFRLRGYEVDDCAVKNKSIGHSHVLEPELRTRQGAEAVIRKMIAKAGKRLREGDYWASGVGITIGFIGAEGFSAHKKVDRFCDDRTFTEHIFSLLNKCRWGKPIYASIHSFNLSRWCGEQISLFPESAKRQSLSRAMDNVNDRYGPNSLYPASMDGAEDSAPDRIPFGQPRYEIRF